MIEIQKSQIYTSNTTVQNLYLFEVGKLMYQFHNNQLPISFENYFTLISHSIKYKTRGITAVTYRLLLFPTNKLQHSIKFQGAKFWNQISLEIKKALF